MSALPHPGPESPHFKMLPSSRNRVKHQWAGCSATGTCLHLEPGEAPGTQVGQPQGLKEAPVIQGMFQPLHQRPRVGDAGCRGEGGVGERTSRVGTRGDTLFLLRSGWMRHEEEEEKKQVKEGWGREGVNGVDWLALEGPA